MQGEEKIMEEATVQGKLTISIQLTRQAIVRTRKKENMKVDNQTNPLSRPRPTLEKQPWIT